MNKSKASSSKKADTQSSIGMSEEEKAQAALKDMKHNSQSILSEGSELPPMFRGMSPLLQDSTSPITTDSETLAHRVSKVVPNPQEKPPISHLKPQSRDEVKNLVIKCSTKIGIVVEQAHMDDLYNLSATSPLDDRFVWAYLRGIAITNQISATTTLTRLVKDIESMMSKTQQYIGQGMDSNKLLSERITMQGQKLDNLVPAVGSLLKAEHGVTREFIKQEMRKSYVTPPLIGESSKTVAEAPIAEQTKPPFPSSDDIAKMCATAGIPEASIPNISSKYAGKVSWKEYTAIMSGGMTKKEAKSMIAGWKGRV
ncbi:TPA_asm: P [Silene gammacytorhabdovirus 1]|nr:TPA_asm: P [Silene gammacytorhabdovirus 1]